MLTIRSRVPMTALALLVPFAIACEQADPEPDPMPMDDPAPAVQAPPAGVQTATDRYIAAWNGDDPAAVAAFFTEDATATVADETYQGRAEIEEEWLREVPIYSNLRTTETSSDQVGQDWRAAGTFTITVSPPDAEPMEGSGSYSITWTRDVDGEWRIRSTEVEPDEPEEPVDG